MFGKIAKLFAGARPPSSVTVEKIRQVFAYGLKYDLTGIELSEHEASGLARMIDFQHEPRDFTIRVALKGFEIGQRVVIPPHIKWSKHPEFAYVGIVDDAVELRYGTEVSSAWYLCPVASNPQDKRKVEALFQFWYERLGLPESLDTSESPDLTNMATVSEPFPGFAVLSLRYAERPEVGRGVTAQDLATRLGYAMDVNWFDENPDLSHFGVTEVTKRGADGCGFDFGPYDESVEDFSERYAVVIRQTAGGGVMLLIQDAAKASYGETVKGLFEGIVAERAVGDDR